MDTTTHILIVDDDLELRELLQQFFRRHGFEASTAADGQQMDQCLAKQQIDLIVLDIMMPGESGLDICSRLRADCHIPIIMLTAVGSETDRIVGLELGADDYLAKPFSPRELLARAKAVLRRLHHRDVSLDSIVSPNPQIAFAGWVVDQGRRRLIAPDGVSVPLSIGEYDLLIAFIQHSQRVLTRDELLQLTRSRESGPFDRTIDVQVSRLRRKIEKDPKTPRLIKTVRGGGYQFTPKVEKV